MHLRKKLYSTKQKQKWIWDILSSLVPPSGAGTMFLILRKVRPNVLPYDKDQFGQFLVEKKTKTNYLIKLFEIWSSPRFSFFQLKSAQIDPCHRVQIVFPSILSPPKPSLLFLVIFLYSGIIPLV